MVASIMHQSCSIRARCDDSSFVEILFDEDKDKKSKEEAVSTSKEGELKPDPQNDSKGKVDPPPDKEGLEGDDPILEDLKEKEPEENKEEDADVKDIPLTKFDSRDQNLIAALVKACDTCYLADHLTVQKVRGSIIGTDKIPTDQQIHSQELFQLRPPANHVVDDIHEHWTS